MALPRSVAARAGLALACAGGLLLGGCGRGSQPLGGAAAPPSRPGTPSAGRPLDSRPYADVLAAHVDARGRVDYGALQRDQGNLKAFLERIADLPPARYGSWPRAERIAFLLNAYNALTLASIVEHDPLPAGIRAIPGVWRIRTHQVMGQRLTLDAIEHRILRRDFNEPRIHAALVCAAASCPPLRREPYSGERLDAQLEEQVRRWLASPAGLRIDRQRRRVGLSPIFDWFAEDWRRADPQAAPVPGIAGRAAVLRFVARHVGPDDRRFLLAGGYELHQLPYDWSLNLQPRGESD